MNEESIWYQWREGMNESQNVYLIQALSMVQCINFKQSALHLILKMTDVILDKKICKSGSLGLLLVQNLILVLAQEKCKHA